MGKLEREKGLFLSLFLCWTGGGKKREKDPSISHTTHTQACWCNKKRSESIGPKVNFPLRDYTVLLCYLGGKSLKTHRNKHGIFRHGDARNEYFFVSLFSNKGNEEKTCCLVFSCCFCTKPPPRPQPACLSEI